jgi:hypothetical protein
LEKAKALKTGNGKYVLVDNIDYEWAVKYAWFCSQKGYVYRHIYKDGKRTTIRIHREILNAPSNLQVDHINGNTLDNRRSNLRLCTQAQNSINRHVRQGKTSKYKGVCWDKVRKHWRAFIGVNGKGKSLGCFRGEVEAAMAYDKTAIELYGEFANINFGGINNAISSNS